MKVHFKIEERKIVPFMSCYTAASKGKVAYTSTLFIRSAVSRSDTHEKG